MDPLSVVASVAAMIDLAVSFEKALGRIHLQARDTGSGELLRELQCKVEDFGDCMKRLVNERIDQDIVHSLEDATDELLRLIEQHQHRTKPFTPYSVLKVANKVPGQGVGQEKRATSHTLEYRWNERDVRITLLDTPGFDDSPANNREALVDAILDLLEHARSLEPDVWGTMRGHVFWINIDRTELEGGRASLRGRNTHDSVLWPCTDFIGAGRRHDSDLTEMERHWVRQICSTPIYQSRALDKKPPIQGCFAPREPRLWFRIATYLSLVILAATMAFGMKEYHDAMSRSTSSAEPHCRRTYAVLTVGRISHRLAEYLHITSGHTSRNWSQQPEALHDLLIDNPMAANMLLLAAITLYCLALTLLISLGGRQPYRPIGLVTGVLAALIMGSISGCGFQATTLNFMPWTVLIGVVVQLVFQRGRVAQDHQTKGDWLGDAKL